jgi:serine/threonine protein kinase
LKILHSQPDFKSNKFLQDSPFAMDFITKCLDKDMATRPNASALLAHPWFT